LGFASGKIDANIWPVEKVAGGREASSGLSLAGVLRVKQKLIMKTRSFCRRPGNRRIQATENASLKPRIKTLV
jgi:hypothetical protein